MNSEGPGGRNQMFTFQADRNDSLALAGHGRCNKGDRLEFFIRTSLTSNEQFVRMTWNERCNSSNTFPITLLASCIKITISSDDFHIESITVPKTSS